MHEKGLSVNSALLELVCRQCELATKTMDALMEYMESTGKESSETIHQYERKAEKLRSDSFEEIRKKYADSTLREDINRAIKGITEIIRYARTTIREMEVLNLHPNHHQKQMALLIRIGTQKLQDGYEKLASGSTDIEEEVATARKAERDTEETYRNALADLFDAHSLSNTLVAHEYQSDIESNGHFLETSESYHGTAAASLAFVVQLFKNREVLRHLSNAADRVLYASDTLHEIAENIVSEKL
jgi:uncharacterized protein Yka (UPF0111/DUF47 family)